MKKKATVLIASIMAFCGINTAHADEGMWTIYNLPNAVYEMMQREGFSMTYDQLYNGENALKNAVVNFSGYCSGVVVSPDGLVFTNHHCGFEAIRSHSTVEHDYMLNGFFAKSYAEELPNENMFVSFMVEQKDVTDKVMSLGYEKLEYIVETCRVTHIRLNNRRNLTDIAQSLAAQHTLTSHVQGVTLLKLLWKLRYHSEFS